MGLVIKKEQVADARGRKRTQTFELTLTAPEVFDIPYVASVHHRWVAEEIRGMLRPRRFDLRKPAIAKLWLDAIERNAPLLKGFFAEEPKLREKMLRWCEKVLKR